MNPSVEKLEALLARVQENRTRPRATAKGRDSDIFVPPLTDHPEEEELILDEDLEWSETPERISTPISSGPIEALGSDEPSDSDLGSAPPEAVQAFYRPISERVDDLRKPVAPRGEEASDPLPQVIAVPPLQEGRQPIARIVSRPRKPTFGQILDRTLSLRPR